MMSVVMTSREFNQGSSHALKIAETQPVYVTKRGKITNVILSYAQFQEMVPVKKTFAELFSGEHAAAEINDDIMDEYLNYQRDVESWGIRELEWD